MIYSNELKNYVSIVCIIAITITCIVGIWKFFIKDNTNSPVKGNVNIDSITNVNNNIKFEVESLDSIKHAKVIEVVALDNDSTLKLFYKLVSE